MSRNDEIILLKFNKTFAENNEVSELIRKSISLYLTLYKEIKEKNSHITETDARLMLFWKCYCQLNQYNLFIQFSSGFFSIDENWLLWGVKDHSLLENNKRNVGVHISYTSFQLFMSALEGGLRMIVRSLEIAKQGKRGKYFDGTEGFKSIYKALIEQLSLKKDYEKLFEILSLYRNTCHNSGLHFSQEGNKQIEYKGITYNFIHGKLCGDIRSIFPLIEDSAYFFNDLVNSKEVIEKEYIEDIYTEEYMRTYF